MYHNVVEIEAALANLAAAHPTLAERIVASRDELRRSHDQLSAPRQRLSPAPPDGALFIFGQHAREWVPPEVGLGVRSRTCSTPTPPTTALAYGGKSYTAAQVRQVLDTVNVFVLACVNPDGRHHSRAPTATRTGERTATPRITRPATASISIATTTSRSISRDTSRTFRR